MKRNLLWLGALLCAHIASVGSQEPCTPVIDGQTPEYLAIQQCLSKGGWVRLESRTYLIERTLEIKSETLLEGPASGNKATLMPAPSLGNSNVIRAQGSKIEFRNIVVSGNKLKRDYDTPLLGWEDNRWTYHYLCDADGWRPASAIFRGQDIDVHDSEFIDAPCGTGAGISGERIRFYRNRVERNGFPAALSRNGIEGKRPWPDRSHQYSDGTTFEYCDGCVVAENLYLDNTDLDLVLGGGPGNWVYANSCIHRNVYGFGCFNIGRFDTGRSNPVSGLKWDGDHENLVFENNSVSAARDTLSFGITVGGHFFTFDPKFLVIIRNGGLVKNNSVSGAQIGLGVDGVEKVVVEGNSLGEPSGDLGNFNYCQMSERYVAGHLKAGAKLQPGYRPATMDGGECKF